MISLPNHFIQETKTNITSISSFINILPDVRPEKAQRVISWLEQSSDTTNNYEILDSLVAKYGSRKEYMDAIHKYSTKNLSINYGSSGQMYSYDPLLTKHPKIRSSIDLKTKLSKISNMKIDLYNQINNYDKLDGIEKCYNCAVVVYWKVEGSVNTTGSVIVFVGGVDNITQNKNITSLNCVHASNIYNEIQVPVSNIAYTDTLPEKYKQKPYPMVYGEVDGAHSSISKIDLSTQQEYKDIVFDNPNVECEGFIDPDLPYATNDYNESAMYKTDRSQIYIADGDNLTTMLRYAPFWLWGDPNSYDSSDIHNGYSWRYTYLEQYRRVDDLNNGIKVLTIVGDNPRRVNPIKNNAAFVQFKDTFNGVTMFNQEEGDDVPNGFDLSYAQDDLYNTDYLPTGLIEDISGDVNAGVYWINNCDLTGADEFFNKGDYQNKDAKLKFRFWTTNTDTSPTGNDPSNDAIETLRGMRCQFLSKAQSINSYRHFVALHFKSKLKMAQYISKIDNPDNDAENTLFITNTPDNHDASIFTYPFGAACTAMYWFAGSFNKPDTADFDGWIPHFYPALDNYAPLICSTRLFPVRYRGFNNTLYQNGNDHLGQSPNMNGALHSPVINGGVLEKDSWTITSDNISQTVSNSNYDVNSDNFYLTNRTPWGATAEHIYDWWTTHCRREGNGDHVVIPWYALNFQFDSDRLAEEDDRAVDAAVTNIVNDGIEWRPKLWSYADTVDTTLMMCGPNQFKLGEDNANSHYNNNIVNHAYNELEIYDLYADRIYMKEDFIESDFFAKVKGRKGYTSVNGSLSSTAITKPNEIIYHFLSDELGLGKDIVINNDDFTKASNENSEIKTSFSINEKKDAKKIIENITKESKVLVKYNSTGTVTLDSMKEYYTDEDVDLTIKKSDIFNYKFKNTKLSEIKNQVKINYNKKYSNNSYINTSGFYTDPITGEDLYSIMVNDILKRSSFFEGHAGNIFNYDEFSFRMYNNLNTDGLPELNSENKIYSVDYYNMRNADTKLEIDCETIRDYKSASELQKYLILWHCNQHLVANIDLPIKYVGLETGDIINFDNLLGDKKAFNFDYTKRYVKNGQVIYPYFMITKIDKSIDKIKIEVIQLHRLDWGLDGHSMNIDSDTTHNSDKEQAEEGREDALQNVVITPHTIFFSQYVNDEHTITITGAYAEIDEIRISTPGTSSWVDNYTTYSDIQDGEHIIGVKTVEQHLDPEERTGTIKISFKDQEQELIVNIEQHGDDIIFGNQLTFLTDTIFPDTISNFVVTGQSDIPNDEYDIIDKIDLTWNFGEPADPAEQIWDIIKIKATDNVSFNLNHGLNGDYAANAIKVCSGNSGNNFGNGIESDWVFIHWVGDPNYDNRIYSQELELVVFQRNAWDGKASYGPITVDSGNAVVVYDSYGHEETDSYSSNREAHFFIEKNFDTYGNTIDTTEDVENQGYNVHGVALDISQDGAPFIPPVGDEFYGYGSGDFNQDGVLNILDVVGIVQVILGPNATEDDIYNCDINGDGIVNILDVIIMVGWILEYGGLIPEGQFGGPVGDQ